MKNLSKSIVVILLMVGLSTDVFSQNYRVSTYLQTEYSSLIDNCTSVSEIDQTDLLSSAINYAFTNNDISKLIIDLPCNDMSNWNVGAITISFDDFGNDLRTSHLEIELHSSIYPDTEYEMMYDGNIYTWNNLPHCLSQSGSYSTRYWATSQKLLSFVKMNNFTISSNDESNKLSMEGIIVTEPCGETVNASEWRGVLSLRGCHDVTIEGFQISNPNGGDGIAVDRYYDFENECDVRPSEIITIEKMHIYDIFRNGITVANAKQVLIHDCIIENIYGTNPQSGIDLEHHGNLAEMDVTITHCTISDAYGGCIVGGFKQSYSGSPISVTIDNCCLENTGNTYGISMINDDEYVKSGTITIKNTNIENCVRAIKICNPIDGNLNSGIEEDKLKFILEKIDISYSNNPSTVPAAIEISNSPTSNNISATGCPNQSLESGYGNLEYGNIELANINIYQMSTYANYYHAPIMSRPCTDDLSKPMIKKVNFDTVMVYRPLEGLPTSTPTLDFINVNLACSNINSELFYACIEPDDVLCEDNPLNPSEYTWQVDSQNLACGESISGSYIKLGENNSCSDVTLCSSITEYISTDEPGSIELTVEGGDSQDVSYEWFHDSGLESESEDLIPGEYIAKVSIGNMDPPCLIVQSFIVEGNSCDFPMTIEHEIIEAVNGDGVPIDGHFKILLSPQIDEDNCSSIFTYEWLNTNGKESISKALTPGIYCVKVTPISCETDLSLCHIITCIEIEDVGKACARISDVEGCPVEFLDLKEADQICNTQDFAITDENGAFCVDIPKDECIDVEIGDCSTFCNNPITANDILLLRKFVLGIIGTESVTPFINIIGDVNNSGNTSTLDMVLIQRHLLGLESLDSDCLFINPLNEEILLSPLEICDGEPIELVLGYLGDIDGSCNCQEIPEKLETILPPKGLNFIKNNNSNAFSFDENTNFYDLYIEIFGNEEIALEDIYVNHNLPLTGINRVDGGFRIAFNTLSEYPVSIEANVPLFTLKTNNSYMLSEESFIINASGNLQEFSVASTSKLRSNDFSNEIMLYSINNTLHLKSSVELLNNHIVIYDVTGNVLLDNSYEKFNLGITKIAELTASGVLFVSLLNDFGLETFKVISLP